MPARLKIYFDGGCRPNPGSMEIAVVVRGAVHLDTDLGEGASMDAEWLALLAAARRASELGLSRDGYVLLGDAVAVIAQANGTQPSRGNGTAHRATLLALGEGRIPPIRYIKRTQNLAGIALARHHAR